MSPLRQSILNSLAYFAAQEQAVTLLELYRALTRVSPGQPIPDFSEFTDMLSQLCRDRVVFLNGFYCLTGHEEDIAKRHGRYIASLKLLKKAKRFAGGLRHIPFVRAAAVSGSVVQLAAGEESDIDIFVVTKEKRIFLARFFVSIYFQLFGGRRHGNKVQKRFCLNHYVAGATKLSSDHNLYTAILYTNFLPILGANYFNKFIIENLPWIKEVLLCPTIPETHYFKNNFKQGLLQRLAEILLYPFTDFLERIASYLQRRRIKVSQTVLVSDKELSFHPNSKGQQILARYKQILEKLEPWPNI